MKIFISWSGPASKIVADFLRNEIQIIFQHIIFFMSDSDLGTGKRWKEVIKNELEGSDFGIICLTVENLNSSWILFEAGALSKFKDAVICPVLINFEELPQSPLDQFQSCCFNEDGLSRLVSNINNSIENIENKVPNDILLKRFKSVINKPKIKEIVKKLAKTNTYDKSVLNGIDLQRIYDCLLVILEYLEHAKGAVSIGDAETFQHIWHKLTQKIQICYIGDIDPLFKNKTSLIEAARISSLNKPKHGAQDINSVIKLFCDYMVPVHNISKELNDNIKSNKINYILDTKTPTEISNDLFVRDEIKKELSLYEAGFKRLYEYLGNVAMCILNNMK